MLLIHQLRSDSVDIELEFDIRAVQQSRLSGGGWCSSYKCPACLEWLGHDMSCGREIHRYEQGQSVLHEVGV